MALAATATFYPMLDGTYTSWTPSTGTAHYPRVNESPCNGNTDYVYFPNGSGLEVRDSYVLNLAAIPDGSRITKITVTPCASRHDTDTSSSTILNVFYRYGSSNSSLKGNYSLSGTTPTVLLSSFWDVDITKGGTLLQVGISFHGGSAGARVSNLKTVIEYE
ncbi:MAG: hypothetical protein RL141_498 [Candidatus Parcubacteria bacterium]